MPNQTDGESDEVHMTDAAAVPSVQTGPNALYAAVRAQGLEASPPLQQRKKIIRIDMTAKGPVATLVQDYTMTAELSALIDQALSEVADDDDTPEQQRLLMSAWQALAMYLATCDDEDKNQAATALKVVSDLMSGVGDGTGPLPTGTFGKTVQMAAAAPGPNKTVYECAMDKRTFSTQQGLINHLQTAHSMNPVKARATAMKAGS